MQAVMNSMVRSFFPIQHTAARLLVHAGKPRVLVRQEIARNAEELRSREEQLMCDMATD